MENITETMTGYPIKDLRWLPIDNIYVGLVKCPYANPNLREGWVAMQWKKNGTPTYKNKERKDLTLKIN